MPKYTSSYKLFCLNVYLFMLSDTYQVIIIRNYYHMIVLQSRKSSIDHMSLGCYF